MSYFTKSVVPIAAIALAATVAAWQPTGSVEELYNDALLPRLRSGVKVAAFSSYDRTGGNNDGFSGAYSKLREEEGNSVIAEMEGPGCIYRLWMTHSIMEEPGLLDRKGEHIRVYLDGAAEPALDVPIQSLFDNSLEHFPQPIAGQGIGGYYTYIPIPYRKSCKVVVDGLGVRFYQLNYMTFPTDEGVKTFEMNLTSEEKQSLEKAVALWKDPLGQLRERGTSESVQVTHQPAGRDTVLFTHTLTANAPTLLHGLTLTGITPEAMRHNYIEFTFSDSATLPVRLPLTFYFGQAFDAPPFQSLLFGRDGDTYYNRVPLVYEGECTIRIQGIMPVEGAMALYRSPVEGSMDEFGVMAAQYNESLPTIPEVYHPFLHAEGQGHVVGTYLVTEGPKGLPYWLEGDDQAYIDGELRIHGTGSEDYFNCGWYALPGRLNGPEALPSHGFPIYGETEHTMRAAAFRWHFTDPMPFDKSIDFHIEHGEANRHIAEYRSVAYYYRAR